MVIPQLLHHGQREGRHRTPRAVRQNLVIQKPWVYRVHKAFYSREQTPHHDTTAVSAWLQQYELGVVLGSYLWHENLCEPPLIRLKTTYSMSNARMAKHRFRAVQYF